MRNLVIGFLFFLLFLPSLSHAEAVNVGFVQGLWYSSEPVFVGVPTRVYVAFRNNTPHDLTGTVRFTDNGVRIGSSYVSVLSGRIAEAWVDWTPTPGDHSIAVALGDAELNVIGENPEPIDIAGIVTEDAVTVDHDTDGDKIGNLLDTDDDGDGVSDEDEKSRGTNPLVANPKPVTEKEVEPEKIPEVPRKIEPETPAEPGEGLEKYLPDGTTASLVETVTEKVADAKKSLDGYREERNAELSKGDETTSTPLIQTLGTSTENATITRSQIEPQKNLLETFISGVATLLKNVYTFILWALSGILAHPAIVELALLLGILYAIYRFARRVGRRPNW
jgi:hypothetical protein